MDKKSDITYISCDVARLGNDRTVIWVWRGLECIKIITYAQNTVDEVANRIKELEEMYWVSREHIVIDSDWVGWGVADMLRGCVNFVNNAAPFKFDIEKKWFIVRNYANLKTQAYFKLKELMERRMIRVYADWAIQDELSQELENIFIQNIDKDGKIKLEGKDLLRQRLNRSPDYADCIMFRMIWVIKEMETKSGWFSVEEIDYGNLLY
jgi:hypothetical protein